MMRDFNTLLDECIDRINAGESIDMCLASYPKHARELEPLLRTVGGVRDACFGLPGVTAKSATRRRLDAAIANSEKSFRKPQRRSGSFLNWSSIWTKIGEEIDMKLQKYKFRIFCIFVAVQK